MSIALQVRSPKPRATIVTAIAAQFRLNLPTFSLWKERRRSQRDEITELLRAIFDQGGFIQCLEVYDHFDVDLVLDAQDQGLLKWYVANGSCDHLITLKKAGYLFLGETPPPSFFERAVSLARRLSGKQV